MNPLAPHAAEIIASADAVKIADPTARLMNQLGLLYKAQIRFSEAEKLYKKAIEIEEAKPDNERKNLAFYLNNLAQLLNVTNRLAEAEPLMRQALAIDEKSYGDEHPNVARDLNNLARLLQDTNRLSEAEPLMRRALAMDEKSFGAEHPNVAIRLNNLATLLQLTNRLLEAEPLMRRHVQIFHQFNQKTKHEHPHWRAALVNYHLLLEEMNLPEAEIAVKLVEFA